MKNLKLLIIILIMFAVVLAGTIIILNIKQDTGKTTSNEIIINSPSNTENSPNISIENNIQEVEEDSNIYNPQLEINTEIEAVTNYSTLYNLTKNITKYFNYIKEGNIDAVNELGGNENYIIANNLKYTIKEAYVTENEYQTKYFVKGTLTIANGDFTAVEQNIFMIIYVDLDTNAYKLETVQEETFAIIALSQNEDITISKGLYNNFEKEDVDDVKQMEIYLEDYLFQIYNNTQKAYDLLDEEYRNKRFGNINEFINYINQKQEQIQNIKLMQYNVIEDDEEKIYVGTDENGNYYKIIETSYMNYRIMLDNYTLKDYSEYTEDEQIEEISKEFIQMLNSKDYTNAYNLLDQTFKTQHFPTQQDFETYVQQNFFERNIIETRKVNEEGICIVVIRENISTMSNKIEKYFKVNIINNTEFTIEFNV